MVFVDNDITFPAWLVRKFLTAGFDAATAACPKRMIDWEKVTRMVGRGFTAEDLDRGVASITNFDFLPGEGGKEGGGEGAKGNVPTSQRLRGAGNTHPPTRGHCACLSTRHLPSCL